MLTVEQVSPDEQADIDAHWDELFAGQESLALLETWIAKTEAEQAAGQLVDLDPGTLNRR